MFYSIGFTDQDMGKAQIGIASMCYDGNPCTMHLNELAKVVKKGTWEHGNMGLLDLYSILLG